MSRFKHQHVVDYLTAWNELTTLCMFKPLDEQVKIIETFRNSVLVVPVDRRTDKQLAYIAAADELLCARRRLVQVDPPVYELATVDPTTRDQYVVKIGNDPDVLVLTDRQQLVVKAALRYMLSNVDDVNDAFAPVPDTETDEFDETPRGQEWVEPKGKIEYAGRRHDEFTEADVNGVLGLFGNED